MVSAAEAVQRQLRPGQLVILQSTTYPGTTLEILLPILETGGRKVGRDFFLGYAPERVDPGNETWTIRTTPKLVAGVTEECRRRTEALYSQIVDTVVPVSSPTVAETAKLHENTFRAVNIALANELALMCNHLGISVWEVVDAASSKPLPATAIVWLEIATCSIRALSCKSPNTSHQLPRGISSRGWATFQPEVSLNCAGVFAFGLT